ncbi:twitchin-like, partial [Centruroides sculpturatus]|uniref:twitchin-like n=1 Tax=Centruroides sculpturatus TaxID=218467 RepID=UPI000C6D8E14
MTTGADRRAKEKYCQRIIVSFCHESHKPTPPQGPLIPEEIYNLDKPTPPQGPLIPEEVRADHVKLKWQRPLDTGGQELQGYVIEKLDAETGRWIPAGEVGPDKQSFTVEGLTPKKKYKFRVKAVNKEGESLPLETDQPILAKNPYDEPGKPGKPDIVDYDNTRVDLKWAAPESDGGRPILHYVIEIKERFSVEWKEIFKTESNKCEATVKDLKENMVCQFRVKAINKAGVSEPSEPTDNHTVKHRYHEGLHKCYEKWVLLDLAESLILCSSSGLDQKSLELQNETQKAALRFERANGSHMAAKEMVQLAEEELNKGHTFDSARQEMLNQATKW